MPLNANASPLFFIEFNLYDPYHRLIIRCCVKHILNLSEHMVFMHFGNVPGFNMRLADHISSTGERKFVSGLDWDKSQTVASQ